MKKLWIIGNGIYAEMLWKYLSADETISQTYQICGFVVDREYIQEKKHMGLAVISFDELQSESKNDVLLVLGIGYSHMADHRETLYRRCKKMGFSYLTYVHPTAVIHSSVQMGEGNIILENVIIEAGCTIGIGNLFYGGAIVGHDSVIGDYNTMSIGAVTAGCVTIGDHCFLGVRSAVRDHVKISDYALIGATAYAYKDIPDYYVVYSPRCEISDNKKSVDLI